MATPVTLLQLLTAHQITALEDTDGFVMREGAGTGPVGAGVALVPAVRSAMLATAPFNTALLADASYSSLSATVTSNTSRLDALAAGSSVIFQRGLLSATANTLTSQSDYMLPSGSLATTSFTAGSVDIYSNSYRYVNTTGVSQTLALNWKWAGFNCQSYTVTLPSTAAGQFYGSQFTSVFKKGTSGLIHSMWSSWQIQNACAASFSAPASGLLYDLRWPKEENPGTNDYGAVVMSSDYRIAMGVADVGLSSQRVESSRILVLV